SGGVTLALILNILEGYGQLPAFGSTELMHLQAEAMRRAFTDRNRYLGDPDFLELPLERLQSQEYADELRAQIDPERASITEPYVEVTLESTQTTHYSIVDAEGNAASVTTTINGSFGSAVAVEGAGFLLNNEMDDFAAAPGKPNQFGLVEGENNAIVPGKRMLSSMTPSVVLDPSGELYLVVGTPGGPTIITSVFHTISNVLDHGMSLTEAIESPRAHHQALPDAIFVEKAGFSEDTLEGLRSLGHETRVRGGVSGDVDAVIRVDDSWLAVADPRRGSGVAAVPAGG
ncbi:MAG: gamma-glutamyltransferase, partial [Acidobacteriota bacterium]